MSAQNLQEFPEFPTWLNARPSTLQEHRGRALALAFVNAGSEWCTQRLAELSQWQARNPGWLQLIVIQVPRFDSERDPERSLKLLRQQGVSAPILLDREWETWRRFGVTSWPTVVLIDAQGRERERLVGMDGEVERELKAICAGQPMPSDEDVRVATERNPEPRLTLRFPTGLAASADRLYIADSGHHRILECNHAGRVLRQFGLGTADFMDGGLGEAAFRRPRGLALAREALYVADSGNHALRRINLATGQVDTLCGNGRAGEPVEGVVTDAAQVSLDSPHGVAVAGNELLVAMAGDNRIWGYDLGRGELRWRAGAGALDERDGSGHLAAFAQPTAVVAVQHTLYVCDALGSSIRSMQLRGDLVQTLVGGQGAWEHGNADGPRHLARLQFPQAIAMDPSGAPVLWIADSGNGSLRSLRLGGGELSTVKLPRSLHGPAGVAALGGTVWIAETDAHDVLRYDIASGELSGFPIQE